VLDKTGTLTEGRMVVVADRLDAHSAPDQHRRLSAIAAVVAAEQASEHPIARAIARDLAARHGTLPAARLEDFTALPGLGVQAQVGIDGELLDVVVGRSSLLAEHGHVLDGALVAEQEAQEAQGRTVIAAAVRPAAPAEGDGRGAGGVMMVVALADRIKPTSREAVAAFHELGLRTVLLTGDQERTARAVAAELGIEHVVAGVMPDGKDAVIQQLQAEGRVVAMVGDGINDAPALARADLGIAMGTGTDVAIEAGEVTLMSGDPRAAADAIALSRRTLSTIRSNLVWAFGYNTLAIPLAAVGLLNPMVAAAAMGFSSVFVVTNSLRLRDFRGARAAAPTPRQRIERSAVRLAMAAAIVAVLFVGFEFQRSLLPGRTIAVTLTASGIAPEIVEVVPGEKVTFVMDADARTSLHLVDVVELSMMRAGAEGATMDHGRRAIGTVVPQGTTVRMTWVVPTDPDAVRRLRLHDGARDSVAELVPVTTLTEGGR
jgi:Cu+-exporting ATPase